MGTVTVERIDPQNRHALREMHRVIEAAGVRPYSTTWTWHEFGVPERVADPWNEHQLLVARAADGGARAAAEIEIPLRDNTHLAWLSLWFDPTDPQAPSAATALVETAATTGRNAGRRSLLAETEWDLDGSVSPHRAVLEQAGFTLGILNAHRVLDLPVDAALLGALRTETAPHHHAYELLSWSGAVPAEWVDGYGVLRSRMATEAPMGKLEFEDEDFGRDRVAHQEARLAAEKRVSYVTIAVEESGAVVGHTELIVPGTDPRLAYQWDTLVLPEHRGHRLGLALKVQNMSAAVDALAGRTLVHTWNADENTPMVSVNERLGFRLVEWSGDFQLQL